MKTVKTFTCIEFRDLKKILKPLLGTRILLEGSVRGNKINNPIPKDQLRKWIAHFEELKVSHPIILDLKNMLKYLHKNKIDWILYTL